MPDHLVIGDVQHKPGCETKHLTACGNLIARRAPDVVVCIGDFWDMPSLSSWDKGKASAENRRYIDDVEAGNYAMSCLLKPILGRKRKLPRFVFTIGNHEQRIERYADSNPALVGKIGYQDLNLDRWEVIDFLDPIIIDGVTYSHYFKPKNSPRPYGGNIYNRINHLGFSFTMGHTPGLEYGRKDLQNGQIICGLQNGAFYLHDEEYKGSAGNLHFRGICYKHGVNNGCYDLETIDMERLLRDYS